MKCVILLFRTILDLLDFESVIEEQSHDTNRSRLTIAGYLRKQTLSLPEQDMELPLSTSILTDIDDAFETSRSRGVSLNVALLLPC